MLRNPGFFACLLVVACGSGKPAQAPDPSAESAPVSDAASSTTQSSDVPARTQSAPATDSSNDPRPADPDERNPSLSDVDTKPHPEATEAREKPASTAKPAPSSPAPTAFDQGNSPADLKITQRIRQAVMADDALSFTAKNIEIVTINGYVTLNGGVKTQNERLRIEAAARKLAGADRVDSRIEVEK
jgi:hyperosmotically inducible periplasmic protein